MGTLTAGGVPSLSEMASSTGKAPQNKTSIKPADERRATAGQGWAADPSQPGYVTKSGRGLTVSQPASFASIGAPRSSSAPTGNGMSASGGQASAPGPVGGPARTQAPGLAPGQNQSGAQVATGSAPRQATRTSEDTIDGRGPNYSYYAPNGEYIGPGSPGYSRPQPQNTDPNAYVGSLGDGGTQFNPGMTNPDGSNSTVPRGSPDGTSPAVYGLRNQDPELIAFLDPDSRAGVQALVTNSAPYSGFPDWQKEKTLNAIQGLVAQGRFDWNDVAGNDAFRRDYIARFGDPVQSSVGAADNTTNPDGSVQGQFEAEQGGAFQAIADNAAAMGDMDVERSDAAASGAMDEMSLERAAAAAAANNDRTAGEAEMSSLQLNDILRQDSPLMSLARQDGIEQANRLGLRNSSLAVGAQQAAMTRQATPLAMQQADVFTRTGMQNQNLESARRDANANREQRTGEFNASQENAAAAQEFGAEAQRREANAGRLQQNNQFNASQENAASSQEFGAEAARRDANSSRETQTAVTNAGMANDLENADRQRELSYNLQQLAGDQDFAKQQVAAQTAIDVANVEGQYKQLISENDTAARMFDSYYQSVESVIGNEEFGQEEAQGRVAAARAEFEAGMEMILGFEQFDLNSTAGSLQGSTPSAPGTPSQNPNAAAWDTMSPALRGMWEEAGFTRDNFPGLTRGVVPPGGAVDFR